MCICFGSFSIIADVTMIQNEEDLDYWGTAMEGYGFRSIFY
jgi:hypothetical protein